MSYWTSLRPRRDLFPVSPRWVRVPKYGRDQEQERGAEAQAEEPDPLIDLVCPCPPSSTEKFRKPFDETYWLELTILDLLLELKIELTRGDDDQCW